MSGTLKMACVDCIPRVFNGGYKDVLLCSHHGHLESERDAWKVKAQKLVLAIRYVRDNSCGVENKSFLDSTLADYEGQK